MGRDEWESEAGGHLRITYCQGTLPGFGSRSKGFAKCRLVATNVAHFLLISFFLFYLFRRNDITGQTLSPPRRLQHQCVEFFHNLVLIAVIGSGLYLTTINCYNR